MSTRPIGADAAELTVADIADLRAYERERDDFLRHVIALKRARRLPVGPIQSLVFDNRTTIRFQIQELARAARIITDEDIESELRIYNPLISRPGKLAATLFIELPTGDQLREWLPKLAGIERAYELHLTAGDEVEIIGSCVDPGHDGSSSRPSTTATVHHLWWPLTTVHAARLEAGPARVVCTHRAYREVVDLSDETRRSLAADLRP